MRTRADGSGTPSAPVLCVLFALGDQVLHGYGIMKAVEERTSGRVSLLPSSLYATIKRMLIEGWIEEVAGPEDDASPGRPRRYYQITQAGREVALREAERMAALLDLARTQGLAPAESVATHGRP